MAKETNISVIIEDLIKEFGVSPLQLTSGRCGEFSQRLLKRLGGETNDTFRINSNGIDPDETTFSYIDPTNKRYYKKFGNLPKDLTPEQLQWADHSWIYYKGKQYDAEAKYGVTNFMDLPFFKRAKEELKEFRPDPKYTLNESKSYIYKSNTQVMSKEKELKIKTYSEKLEKLVGKKVILEAKETKMTDEQFWKIIDTAKEDADKLEEILLKIKPQHIIEFNNIFYDYVSKLSDVCEDYWEGISSDGFDYAMRGLVALGKKAVMNALKHPESQDLEELENEDFGSAASTAFEKLTDQYIDEYDPNKKKSPYPTYEEFVKAIGNKKVFWLMYQPGELTMAAAPNPNVGLKILNSQKGDAFYTLKQIKELTKEIWDSWNIRGMDLKDIERFKQAFDEKRPTYASLSNLPKQK